MDVRSNDLGSNPPYAQLCFFYTGIELLGGQDHLGFKHPERDTGVVSVRTKS